MSAIVSEIEVDRSVRLVYNQWMHFESFPRFMTGVQSVEQVTDYTSHWVVQFGPIKREFDAEMTGEFPDERIEWKSVNGPAHRGLVTFTAVDNHKTRVRLEVQWEPDGFFESAAAASSLDSRAVARDLENFKRLMESDELGGPHPLPRKGAQDHDAPTGEGTGH